MEIDKKEKQRTILQNRSLHLYFTKLAEALNDAGYDMKKTLKHDMDIPWTQENVKVFMWHKMQAAMFPQKEDKNISTTDLTTSQIDKVYDAVNKVISERTGVFVPFPSLETLEEEQK